MSSGDEIIIVVDASEAFACFSVSVLLAKLPLTGGCRSVIVIVWQTITREGENHVISSQPKAIDMAKRKFITASNYVAKGNCKILRIYREEPVDTQDSGWFVFSGDEDQEYINEPTNFSRCETSKILEIDPSIASLLDSPPGSEFVRDKTDESFRTVKDTGSEDIADLHVLAAEEIVKSPSHILQYFLEGSKCVYDSFKHLTTLSTGSILILVALLEKLFESPEWTFLVAISFVCFIITMTFSIVAMWIMASSIRDMGTTAGAAYTGVLLMATSLISYTLGVISLVVFGLKNFL